MVKSITSAILWLSILGGIQQFSSVSCEDCNSFDCIINEILSFVPFASSSGYEDISNGTGTDDYYYDVPFTTEEIIIIPLTLSAPEEPFITTSGSTISPTTVPGSGSASADNTTDDEYYSGTDVDTTYPEDYSEDGSGIDAYDYGHYSYPVPSSADNETEYGSETAESNLLDEILGMLGLESASASGLANDISAPSAINVTTNAPPAPFPVNLTTSTPAVAASTGSAPGSNDIPSVPSPVNVTTNSPASSSTPTSDISAPSIPVSTNGTEGGISAPSVTSPPLSATDSESSTTTETNTTATSGSGNDITSTDQSGSASSAPASTSAETSATGSGSGTATVSSAPANASASGNSSSTSFNPTGLFGSAASAIGDNSTVSLV